MRAATFLLAALLPVTAAAQEDDRSYLTAFLEDNLSSAGRKVTITGFTGALSSRATMTRLEIADDQGIWITLDDVVLDWSRSSLLSGELVVNELSAGTINVNRLPATAADGSALPSPEAAGFSLPELPVSIDIGSIHADRIDLGAPVLGEPVQGRLEASLTLNGGAGDAAIVLERTDGPESRIALDAAYSNATGTLSLDLSAKEDADGIAARLLGLPGAPAVDLSIRGSGPLSDFAAEVLLESDGVERLAGPIRISQEAEGQHRFIASVSGNMAPLFLPQYAAFLGDRVALELDGKRWSSGQLALDRLTLSSQALRLDGSLQVAADGLPQAFDIQGDIGLEDGGPVLLPLPGAVETRLKLARLRLFFDAASDNGWSGEVSVLDLDRSDFAVASAELAGSGRIGRGGGIRSIGATFDFRASGLDFLDAALNEAIGATVAGDAVLHWQDGKDAVSLPRLSVTGDGYAAKAGLRVEGLSSGLRTEGAIDLTASSFARFSALLGRPLAGSGTVRLEGWASRLSGEFDVVLEATTQGLALGIAQLDRLLEDEARLTASAARGTEGTILRSADLVAKGLEVSAGGRISSHGSDLTGTLSLADLGDLDPAYGGAISAEARFTGTPAKGTVLLTGKGRGLSAGQDEVDRLLAGETGLAAEVDLKDGVASLRDLRLQGQNLTAELKAAAGSKAFDVTGRIRDLALLAPGFPGAVTLSGKATPGGGATALDVRVTGPAGIDARIGGTFRPGNADLTLRGTSAAAVLNGVVEPLTLAGAVNADLRLRGPLALSGLSGRVTLSGGRIAYPIRGLSLGRTELVADLAAGRAKVSATAEATAGGRIRLGGTVGLTAAAEAELDITLEALRLRDPELFDTTAWGQLRLSGPVLGRALLSGALSLGETNLIVRSTGYASAADLDLVTHVRDRAEVRATRKRAGIGGAGGGTAKGGGGATASGPDWLLDVNIDAPNRIFLRGRGLDAELGGSIHLGGSLRAVAPSGSIGLIRGRLDILGKRLDLSEASLVLEGDLVPYITVVASNETDGVLAEVRIEGPADAPEVKFSSLPEMPEEEVMAWLLFGRGLTSVSPLQALELANAVAVLAGRGGEGVISRLRKTFGLDDLDIKTAEDGSTTVSVGKYVAENVYTEIEVDQKGQSRINLNLNLRKDLTLKGQIGSDGDSGIGIYLEKDY